MPRWTLTDNSGHISAYTELVRSFWIQCTIDVPESVYPIFVFGLIAHTTPKTVRNHTELQPKNGGISVITFRSILSGTMLIHWISRIKCTRGGWISVWKWERRGHLASSVAHHCYTSCFWAETITLVPQVNSDPLTPCRFGVHWIQMNSVYAQIWR